MVEENLENMLVKEGIPVPNVWVELEGEFLDFDKKNLSAKILGIIDREWVALKLNELFVIEYYSRKI